jgi:ribosomal protein L20A (L18A)
MVNDKEEEHPIEHIVALFAANFKLKRQQFSLEELLFLHEATMEAINGREHEVLQVSESTLH